MDANVPSWWRKNSKQSQKSQENDHGNKIKLPTTFHIVVMSLSTQLCKVWKSIDADCLEFLQLNHAVFSFIHDAQDGIDDVVRLLLMSLLIF